MATHIDSWENGSQNWTRADEGGIPPPSRVRDDAVPAGDDRPRRGQPGGLGAFPLGPAADDLGARDRELRGRDEPAGPRAWPEVHGRGLRQPVRPSPLCGPVRRADGRVLGRRRGDRDLPRHGLGRARLRQADRGRRGLHRGGPGTLARAPGDPQGARRPGLLRGHQPLRVPSLRPPAVDRRPPGHDHGPVGRPLRADADLVGLDDTVARLPRPVPVHAPAGPIRRRHLLPPGRGPAPGISATTSATDTTGTSAAPTSCSTG